MRQHFAVSFVAVAIVIAVMALAQTPAAAQSALARQAVPRTPDGKPDFTGVWAGPGFSHKVGPNDTDTPQVTPSPYAQQWIQAPGQMVVLYEYMHFFRTIPTDGRPHHKDEELTWMGDSIGKWEGDTLVIDTVGLKEWMLDATHTEKGSRWHSDALHMIERLRYIDPMTVSYQVTIDDRKIFTAPWTQDFQMKLHPTWQLYEFVCEENDRCRAGKCVESDAQKTPK